MSWWARDIPRALGLQGTCSHGSLVHRQWSVTAPPYSSPQAATINTWNQACLFLCNGWVPAEELGQGLGGGLVCGLRQGRWVWGFLPVHCVARPPHWTFSFTLCCKNRAGCRRLNMKKTDKKITSYNLFRKSHFIDCILSCLPAAWFNCIVTCSLVFNLMTAKTLTLHAYFLLLLFFFN